jgi:hypothetical protein
MLGSWHGSCIKGFGLMLDVCEGAFRGWFFGMARSFGGVRAHFRNGRDSSYTAFLVNLGIALLWPFGQNVSSVITYAGCCRF